MQPVDASEIQCAALLARRTHGGNFRGNETLDNAVGVPDLVVNTCAALDHHKLSRCRHCGHFNLLAGVCDKAVERDDPHLVAEAVEAAELVENAVAPEEFVGGFRKFGTME